MRPQVRLPSATLAAAIVWLLACMCVGARFPAAAMAAALAGLWLVARAEGGVSRRPELALGLGFVALYMSTFRWHGGDDIPNSLLPFAILKHRTLALDQVLHPWLTGRESNFTVPAADGRLLSVFPILPGLLALPLYLPAALADAPLSQGFLHDLSKLAGACITAASVAVFYAALSSRCSRRWALWLTVVYGAGSWAMSVSSQALWQHGPAQLGVAIGLWGLAAPGSRRAFAAGLGFGLAVAARPDHVFIAAAATGLWATTRRRELPAFFAGAALPAAGLLAYWQWYMGRPLPPELDQQEKNFAGFIQWESFPGFFITPSRGLLAYFPPFVFSAWAAARRRDAECLWFAAACAATLVFLSRYDNWVAGMSFGNRYFASMSLLFLWWLAPLEPEISRTPGRRRAWAGCAAAAVIIHALGGYLRWPGTWNMERTKRLIWSPSEHPLPHLLDAHGGLADWPEPLRWAALAALVAGWWLATKRLEKTLAR